MTVETMDSKTEAEKFENSWAQFKRKHGDSFKAFRRFEERDRWSLYDCLKQEWSKDHPGLSDFYTKAVVRIAQELRV